MSSTRPEAQSSILWDLVPFISGVLAIVASFFVWQWWIGALALVAFVSFNVVVITSAAGDYYPGKVANIIIDLTIFVVIGGLSCFVFYRALSFGVLGVRSGAIAAVATFVLLCISWRKTSPEQY